MLTCNVLTMLLGNDLNLDLWPWPWTCSKCRSSFFITCIGFRSDSWSIYEKLHNDPYMQVSAHAHWLRVREGEDAIAGNFKNVTSPTILYSKTSGPQALTLRGRTAGNKSYVHIFKRQSGCHIIKQNVQGGMFLAPCIVSILKTCTSDFVDCLAVMLSACCKHSNVPHSFSTYERNYSMIIRILVHRQETGQIQFELGSCTNLLRDISTHQYCYISRH